MKYAAIISDEEGDLFLEFKDQEACKIWIKCQKERPYRLIEFQEIEVKVETTVTFKKPGVTRTS